MVPANSFWLSSAHFPACPGALTTPRDWGFIQWISVFRASHGCIQQALSNCWKDEWLTWSSHARLPVSWKESHLLNSSIWLNWFFQVFILCLLYARHICLLSCICCQRWSQSWWSLVVDLAFSLIRASPGGFLGSRAWQCKVFWGNKRFN